MKSKAFIAAALLSTAAAQSQTFSQTFDDTDPLITYSGEWQQQAGLNGPTNGTQSYSLSPSASYSFSFTGTGFSICAGKKVDRGTFSVTIDDVLAGTGNQTSDSLNNAPACETVFEVENLAPTGHNVVVSNTGSGRASFLTVDSITLDVLVPNASSSAAATSSASSSPASSSTASQSSATVVTGAGASAAAQESSGGGTSTAAIAGGVVAGIVALALVAMLWFCCARRRKQRQAVGQEDETRSNPFTDGDQGSNRTMSQVGGAAPVMFESTSTQPDQATNMYAAAPPPAIPYAGAYQSPEATSTPLFDNRYSIMSAAAGGAAPAPSQRTSYASPAPQLPAMTDRSPSPFGAFPVDVQEPLEEDPYGGMESEDESANQHSRGPSEADIVASRKGSHSLKRKPVPEA